MAELFGRATGLCGGLGGSMHLMDKERHFYGGYGIVGGSIPLAVGLAFAIAYREEESVAMAMFGDGAVNQGVLAEVMNMAELWRLPVVFFVLNNQYGMGTAVERASAETGAPDWLPDCDWAAAAMTTRRATTTAGVRFDMSR